MKHILAGTGAIAIIALALWLIYQGGVKLIDIGAEGARSATAAEYAPREEALKLQILKDAIAMEAATFLINQSVLSGKIMDPTIKVCVETPNQPGTLKLGPWLREGYMMCDKSQYTVTFPVAYNAHGKATIGTPTVAQ